MEVVPHPTEFIAGYELSWPDKKPIPFGVDEVIHLKYPSPSDPYYGISPLTAAAAAADIDTFQHDYQHGFYQNSAIPPIALVTDKALGDVARKKLKEAWQEGFGGSSNQGKTPVLDNGLKVQPIGVSPKDLDWLATNRATRDDILAIFGVPASKLGMVEDVNRSSAVANDYTFAKNTIEPILGLIDEKLTQNLARRFDQNLYIKHDSTIPKDEEARARIMQMRLGAGMTTRNEERSQDGFDDVEGGDEILVPVNYQSLDRALNPPVPVEPSQAPAPVVNNSVTLPEIKMPDIHVTTPAVNVENVARKVTADVKTTKEIKRVFRDEKDRIAGIETVERQEIINGE